MRVEPPSLSTARDPAPVSDAIRSRERALSLLRRANRWLIGLAVLLAGALTGLTAHAFHSTASAQTRSATSQGSGESSGGGASTSQLQSPASPPSAASSAPASPAPAPAAPVVSGGS